MFKYHVFIQTSIQIESRDPPYSLPCQRLGPPFHFAENHFCQLPNPCFLGHQSVHLRVPMRSQHSHTQLFIKFRTKIMFVHQISHHNPVLWSQFRPKWQNCKIVFLDPRFHGHQSARLRVHIAHSNRTKMMTIDSKISFLLLNLKINYSNYFFFIKNRNAPAYERRGLSWQRWGWQRMHYSGSLPGQTKFYFLWKNSSKSLFFLQQSIKNSSFCYFFLFIFFYV